jgi:hypothetical protein
VNVTSTSNVAVVILRILKPLFSGLFSLSLSHNLLFLFCSWSKSGFHLRSLISVKSRQPTVLGARLWSKQFPQLALCKIWGSHGGEYEDCDCPDDGGSKDLWNAGKLLPDYTVLQPRRQQSFNWHYVVHITNPLTSYHDWWFSWFYSVYRILKYSVIAPF